MTCSERTEMLTMVAAALEAAAEEAEDLGDAKMASNSTCLAATIRGCALGLAPRNLKAAELLLEQGIVLVHGYSMRSSRRSGLH
jgi:hypothetical protein